VLEEVTIPQSVLRRSYAFERFGAQAAVLDASGIIVETNEAWRLFAALNGGDSGTTGPGIDYLRVCDQADAYGAPAAAAVAAGLRSILQGKRRTFEFEYPCPSPIEDRWFLLHAAAAPVRDGAGVVLFHVNVTAQRLLEYRLGPDARRDPATGFPDRRAAMRCITDGLTHASLVDERLTVMNMSIDGLDAIEVDLGRPAVDTLLVQVMARTLRVLRAEDQVRQLGRSNLVAVCADLDDGAATAIMERLRTAIAVPFQLGGSRVSVAMNIGVASAGPDSTAIGLLVAATAITTLRPRPPPRPAARTKPEPIVDRAAAISRQALQAQRDAVVARSTEIVLYFEPDGTIAWASPAIRNLVGAGPETLIGRNGLEMIHPDDRETALSVLGTIPNTGDHARAEFRVVTDGGAIHWVEETVTNLVGDPQIGYVVGNLRDITQRKNLEETQETDRRRLADAQRLAHLGSFEHDPVAGTITCSVELKAILGLAPDATPSLEAFADRIHPDDLARVESELDAAMLGQPDVEYSHRIVRPDGIVRWVDARLTRSTDPTSRGVSGTLLDVTDRKQLELELLEQATHDPLTGLANRVLLLTQLGDILAATDADHAGVGVLLFDVDRFKLINDSFGHDRGDQLLLAIAEALRATLGPADIAARFGSDAFAIVTPKLESSDEALELAHRLRARLADGLVVGDDSYLPTISVGIVIAKRGDTPMTALRDAETAMYRAKEQGRDRAEWFDPSLHRDVVTNFEVERDLRVAMEHDELFLEFQPVLDLETGEIASCEALVRWHHPTRGRLDPDDFIPIAENTGLIVLLGRWVLRDALATAAGWPDAVRIAVNLSPRELAEPDLITFVSATLAQLGFPATRVIFEITETAVIQDPTAAARAIAALRTLGVSIVIDDFGTGYTSLSFLRDYPLDGLKIDRSFVTEIERSPTAIVDAMIRMSSALGLEVIAEGIETEAELSQLRSLGCRYIQGYLVSKPVAPEDLSFTRRRARNRR
jgi:diguanylate cyclase (GGDEF)-like protein/PAS domain S-box-containing protein